MKKIFLLLLLLPLFVACSDDDDCPDCWKENYGKLTGQWSYISKTSQGTDTTVFIFAPDTTYKYCRIKKKKLTLVHKGIYILKKDYSYYPDGSKKLVDFIHLSGAGTGYSGYELKGGNLFI